MNTITWRKRVVVDAEIVEVAAGNGADVGAHDSCDPPVVAAEGPNRNKRNESNE